MYDRKNAGPGYLEFTGLSNGEAEASRRRWGSNQLTPKTRKSFLRQYLASFGDPIIKILLCALFLNVLFVFRGANWYEAAGVAVAVFLATFVSTLSEYGSESAFAQLLAESDRISCRVLRGGSLRSLPLGEVVSGDLVMLQAGEKIPADGLLIKGELAVDQSALNGESKEAKKRPEAWPGKDASGERDGELHWDLLSPGHLFRGSVVSQGEGLMRVLNVGDRTFYGHMAKEMQEETRQSPLQVKLSGLARTISKMGYLAAALIAFLDLFGNIVVHNDFLPGLIAAELSSPQSVLAHVLHALTLAITIVVVAVPEGLPMMITVVLSSNMLRMKKDRVMVRKLSGIETAGSMNILFTDKTGTLTKGRLSMTQFVTGDGQVFAEKKELARRRELYRLITLSGLCNTSSMPSENKALGGNATDRALLEYLLPLEAAPAFERGRFLPFDSGRKLSAAEIQFMDPPAQPLPASFTLVKGAPEKLLPACGSYLDGNGRLVPLSNPAAVTARWREMTRKAVRVLALAISPDPLPGDPRAFDPGRPGGVGRGLILIGLAGIRDQLRPEAKAAVAQVERAGIQVVMVTGDNPDTARAVAEASGLLQEGDGVHAVLTSREMAGLSDEELTRRLPGLRVVARAMPADKSRLVRLAQAKGLVAGMTGDGINDAPALKKADVGFAMGDGTEVAKEAGDIIILDNNIASIAKAVLYGRTIFKSIRKFIVFQLTMNLCAVGVSLLGPICGLETPITVIQMLWVNIIMDTLAGLAFAGEPPLAEYMEEAPILRDEPVLSREMKGQILFMGGFALALSSFFLLSPWVKEFYGYADNSLPFMSAFFTLFIFCGIFNSFNTRTPRLDVTAHLGQNPGFLAIMALIAAVQIVLLYKGGSLFRTCPLSLEMLYMTLVLAALVIPADFIRKALARLRRAASSPSPNPFGVAAKER